VSARPGDAVDDAPSPACLTLARLALDDATAARLVADCRRVVDAWRGLPPHPEEPGPPRTPVALADVLRDDEPAPGLSAADALRNAPDVADGAFRVPRGADVD
jgi:aspartyl/glutamyl-tRNA(Asn/Gln) amidotransferase C subunit